jgi:hypothetical protein
LAVEFGHSVLRGVLKGKTSRNVLVLSAVTEQPQGGDVSKQEGAVVVADYLDGVSVVVDQVLIVAIFFERQQGELDGGGGVGGIRGRADGGKRFCEVEEKE